MSGDKAITGAIERLILGPFTNEWDDGWYNGPEGPDWDNSVDTINDDN
jgi:hypothetical protein